MVQKARSQEEKERAMLDFFYNSGEFFSIKEMETTCAKKIGVSSMQIKALLKALTDNSLVRVEKIGSGNYYWAFPSDGKCNRANRIGSLTEKTDNLTKDLDQLNVEISNASLARENLVFKESRESDLHLLDELRKRHANGAVLIEKRSQASPELFQKLRHAEIQLISAINSHTENINIMISYLCKLSFMESSVIEQEFGLKVQDLEEISG